MTELKRLREKIDNIDMEILRLIAERAETCRTIGFTKKTNGIPIKDSVREGEIYVRIREESTKLGLNSAQVEAVYHEIVNMCSHVQE